jgi:hypothetical protein
MSGREILVVSRPNPKGFYGFQQLHRKRAERCGHQPLLEYREQDREAARPQD